MYIIQGKPVPLARPRFTPYTNKVYDAQKNEKLVTSIQLQLQHGSIPLLIGPLHMNVTFYMPIPIHGPNGRKKEGHPHQIKPDLSNLIKWCEDVAVGVILSDDAIIAAVTAKKIYSANPRTEFFFSPLL